MRSTPFLICFAIVLLALGLLVFSQSSPLKATAQDDGHNIVIANKTSAFHVIEAKRGKDSFTLTLKNNYGRRITAFVITIEKNFRITEDFISSELSEVGIDSQGTFQRTYPLSSSLQDQPSLDISIQSVVFDDKTGDGDPIIFEDIRDERLGRAVQVKRALKLLDKYLSSFNPHEGVNTGQLRNDIQAALNRPEPETFILLRELHPLGTINRKGTNTLSDFVLEGLAAGEADALRRIEDVEHSANRKDSLLKIADYYQKLLERI